MEGVIIFKIVLVCDGTGLQMLTAIIVPEYEYPVAGLIKIIYSIMQAV